jgi:hypothetical protein
MGISLGQSQADAPCYKDSPTPSFIQPLRATTLPLTSVVVLKGLLKCEWVISSPRSFSTQARGGYAAPRGRSPPPQNFSRK